MKLGKDEIQKIFLSVLLLIGLLYCYFTMLLAPLSKDEDNAKNTIADLKPKITSANATIRDVAAREKSAPAITQTVDQIKSLIPEGAPIAWFPPMMTGFFKRHNIEASSPHMAGEGADRDLPGFKKLSWTVSLPHVEAAEMGKAISDLENEHPLIEITNIQVNALKENPQYQNATITLATLVKQ